MRKHLAVALKNPESIQELFGANDDNLAVFEELLGIRLPVGNQISQLDATGTPPPPVGTRRIGPDPCTALRGAAKGRLLRNHGRGAQP
jgi:hypothetical protein